MAEVTVTLVGRVGQPPILRSGARGDWATFTVATNPRYRQGGDWVDGPTSWFTVNADGDLAHNVVSSIVQGQQVIVHGTVTVRETRQQDGTTSRYVNVKASAVGPDLRWGTARFTKAERPAAVSPPVASQEPTAPDQADGWGTPMQDARQPVAAAGWSAGSRAEEDDVPF